MTQAEYTAAAEKRFSDSDSATKWTDMYSSDTEHLDERNFRQRRDITVEYVLSIIPAGGRVLDVGCGAAPVVSELRRNGVTCVGLEYAEDMLRHAQERLKSMGLDDGDLYQGDCRKMPFDDHSFDIIVCLGVISYVEHYEEVLAEIRRLLKPGGRVIISFRNKFNRLYSDPVRMLKTAVKSLSGRAEPEKYVIGRFMDFREFQKSMSLYGFRYRDFFGIGFGPFKINHRRIFSERSSIKISDFLTSTFNKLGIRAPFRWMADVSLWVYTTEGSADGEPMGH